MVLKKKEIIAASLVVLIGVAGYLNWSYQDTIRVQDGESYVETGKKLGEAQYVSSDTVAEETSTDNAEQNDGEQAEETAVTEDNGEQATDSQESNVTVETASDSGNYFEQAKMNKETSRSKSLEILNQTAEALTLIFVKKPVTKFLKRQTTYRKNRKSKVSHSQRVTVKYVCM